MIVGAFREYIMLTNKLFPALWVHRAEGAALPAIQTDCGCYAGGQLSHQHNVRNWSV